MFSANGHSSQSSLQPHQGFNISQSAQQEGMSSAEGQAPVESDNNIKSVTAWHLIDIRSNFPPDLTGRVVREGQEPFSSGSFGDIFRGTLRMGGRSIYVAVKAIRTYTDDDGDDAKRGQRFRREITTWLKLDHNNVLPLFGTTMNFGRFPAMVCPWLENGSLTSYLERPDRNITTPARLFLVSGVAAGLQYLHSQSVVHGDLSGSNVLVDGNGRACISDFGLSTLLTQLGRSTFATSHQHLGTLRWTAPELLELSEPDGEDELPQIIPSPRSDVYSFGRIILQVCPKGKVPYHYWTREAQVMRAISRGVIPQRPRQELVTDHQWLFMQRCWAPVDAGELRPCVEEIVEFVREELVNIAKA
ncbi:kinase-like protein [Paxillus ammoniavirescens]|nr:kinase-like protein [Paxillus ammoniavirescens]